MDTRLKGKIIHVIIGQFPRFFPRQSMNRENRNIFMSKTWEEKRELYLNLGTQHYQKPKQLPACNAVFDTAINRQSKSENYVEPVHPYNYVLGKRLLYVNGLPSTKKGFQITDRSGANGLCSRREAQVV